MNKWCSWCRSPAWAALVRELIVAEVRVNSQFLWFTDGCYALILSLVWEPFSPPALLSSWRLQMHYRIKIYTRKDSTLLSSWVSLSVWCMWPYKREGPWRRNLNQFRPVQLAHLPIPMVVRGCRCMSKLSHKSVLWLGGFRGILALVYEPRPGKEECGCSPQASQPWAVPRLLHYCFPHPGFGPHHQSVHPKLQIFVSHHHAL